MPPLRLEDTEKFLTNLGVESDTQTAIKSILLGLERNPRKLKRFLNNVEIQHRLVTSRKLGIEKNILVKMACITYGWKDLWKRVLEKPYFLTELQKYAASESLENEVINNPEIKAVFENDGRLQEFLGQKPYFSENDLETYIFLAKATPTDISGLAFSDNDKTLENPYVATYPIMEGDLFFGREKMLLDIAKDLTKGDIPLVSIFGQRKIGKTSFLFRLLDKLVKQNSLPVRMDGQFFGFRTRSVDEFLFEFARIIDSNLKKRGENIQLFEYSENTTALNFREYIRKILDQIPEQYLILVLDEFESVFMSNAGINDWQVDAFSYLRAMLMEFSNFRIVFCGARSLHDFSESQDSYGSPLYSIGKLYQMGRLDEDATTNLIKMPAKGIIEYTTESIDYLREQTGGHPFLVQGTCHALYSSLINQNKKIAKLDDSKTALSLYISSMGAGVFYSLDFLITSKAQVAILQAIVSMPDQKGNLDEIVTRSSQANISKEIIRRNLIRLCNIDILVRNSEEEYCFSVPVFGIWLKDHFDFFERLYKRIET